MILEETYNLLGTKYRDKIENLTISDVRFGVYLSAVKLSDGSYGTVSTLQDENYHCVKKNRDYSEFTPTKIAGLKVTDLFNTTKKTGLTNTLRIAVLNAISSSLLSNGNYKILENADPVNLIDLDSKKTVTIVGAFHSYIEKVTATGNKLYVLELDENAITDEYKKYYVPAEDYRKVLPDSDIIIITGLTLVNNTIDGLLSAIPDKSQVIVTGPSSSLVPDVLFQNKVNIIGASRIINPELLFTLVSEFGGGYHLFKYCAQKICIINE